MPFLANSKHLARVWLAAVRASMVRELEFRTNFFSGLLRQFLWLAAFILFIETVFHNTNALAGWQKSEVLIILALSRFFEGFVETFFGRNIMGAPEAINEGQMDFILIKPVPAQLFMAFRRFYYSGLGNILAGIVLLIYASSTTGIALDGRWLLLLPLATAGLAIYYSILILLVTIAFYAEQFKAFFALTRIITEPLTVPLDIFPIGAQIAFTYLIPIAFIVFVPAQALTGRLSWWQVPLAMGIAAVFLVLANLAWRAGLRRYSSASS